MALKHQNLSFENSLVAQREVNSHLVTIEVGVESRTCQWVELDGLTLNKFRLEGLNTETVKRRGTVEKHGMTFHYILKDIPDNRLTAIYNLLGTLHGLHYATLNKLANDKRLVEFGSHQLWKTALAHLQLRTYNDNRTG